MAAEGLLVRRSLDATFGIHQGGRTILPTVLRVRWEYTKSRRGTATL